MIGKSRKSSAVVDFIGSLMPVYMPESGRDGKSAAAICLETGTRISPIEESDDDAWVHLSFANSARHEFDVPASIVAGLAIGRYVALTYVGASDQARNSAMHHFLEHCRFKTGVSAYLPNLSDPDNPIRELAQDIAGWTARVAVGSL